VKFSVTFAWSSLNIIGACYSFVLGCPQRPVWRSLELHGGTTGRWGSL
jgi:hypothetical protein